MIIGLNKPRNIEWVGVFFVVGALGCGDDDRSTRRDAAVDAIGDATGDAMGDATVGGGPGAQAFCSADIARDTRCGEMPEEMAECVAENACTFDQLIRPDAVTAVAACIQNLACNTSDDDCFRAPGLGIAPTPGADAFETACTMRRQECGGTFSDDFCSFDIGSTQTIAAAQACVTMPCDQIDGCFDGLTDCR
ncbi:MAG: hypothetical protein AAGF12_34985 [Myxococcota bacterium]